MLVVEESSDIANRCGRRIGVRVGWQALALIFVETLVALAGVVYPLRVWLGRTQVTESIVQDSFADTVQAFERKARQAHALTDVPLRVLDVLALVDCDKNTLVTVKN